MEVVQESEGLLPLLRQIQIHQQPGVVRTLELGLGVGDLLVEILQLPHEIVVQGHIPLLHPVIEEEEHVDEGHAVVVDVVEQPPVLLVVGGVGGVEKAPRLDIQVRQLRELPGGQLVRQHVAVLHLHIGKAQGVVHLGQGRQGVQQAALPVVIPGGDHHCQHVLGAEGIVDPFFCCGGLTLGLGLQQRVAVGVGALVGEEKGPHQHQSEHRRHHEFQPGHQPPQGGDFGDKAAVGGLFDEAAEDHQQPRHQGEHREDAEEDGLHQYDAQVQADAKLHEHHGDEARQGGQAAGGDLRNGLAQCQDAGLPGPGARPLLAETVAEDDGVVDGQGQLQHHGDGVGDERDLPAQEVGALVEDGRRHEGQQQHRDLPVGAGGQQQHRHDDDGGDHQNGAHLRGQGGGLVLPHLRGDGHVVARQGLPDGVHGGKAHRVCCLAGKGHVKEGGGGAEVLLPALRVGAVAEIHGGDPLDVPQPLRKALRLVVGDVGDHHPGGAQGGELLLHEPEALTGFRLLRQVVGDVVVHLYPAAGKEAENDAHHVDEEKQVPLIHDHRGQAHEKAGFLLVLLHGDVLLAHLRSRPSQAGMPVRGKLRSSVRSTASTPSGEKRPWRTQGTLPRAVCSMPSRHSPLPVNRCRRPNSSSSAVMRPASRAMAARPRLVPMGVWSRIS